MVASISMIGTEMRPRRRQCAGATSCRSATQQQQQQQQPVDTFARALRFNDQTPAQVSAAIRFQSAASPSDRFSFAADSNYTVTHRQLSERSGRKWAPDWRGVSGEPESERCVAMATTGEVLR